MSSATYGNSRTSMCVCIYIYIYHILYVYLNQTLGNGTFDQARLLQGEVKFKLKAIHPSQPFFRVESVLS